MSEQIMRSQNQAEAPAPEQPSQQSATDYLTEHMGASSRFGTNPRIVAQAEDFLRGAQPQARSSEAFAEMVGVVADGVLGGEIVGLPEASRNPQAALNDRLWMAALVHNDPQTAGTIARNRIAGFHVTKSPGLAGLVEDGAMFSGSELQTQGKGSASGAHDASKKGTGQTSTSFGVLSATRLNIDNFAGGIEQTKARTNNEVVTDLQTIIQRAQEMIDETPAARPMLEGAIRNTSHTLQAFQDDPNSLRSTMLRIRFPVAIGVTRDFVLEAEQTRQSGNLLIGQSYFGEFRPAATTIPIKDTPVMAVPQTMMDGTKQVLEKFGHSGVEVIPLESIYYNDPRNLAPAA